jgi:Protein of unknown function (DUF1579)
MSFEESVLSGSPHHFLAQLVGGWAGKTRTWLDPDGVPVESQMQGSIQLILGGRFVIFLYQSAIDGEPQHGMFTFGYNTSLDQFEASWVDSFHNNTAIMFCVGNAIENGLSLLGSYPDPTGGPDWGWRTDVELVNVDQLVITSYNISPEGDGAKATEAQLTRMKK